MIAAVAFLASLLAAAAPAPALSDCVFQPAATGWTGGCGAIARETPRMRLARAAAITSGRYRDDAAPSEVWSGEMSLERFPDQPLELELYAGGFGVLRTELGWYPVTNFEASPSALRFRIDTHHEVEPSGLDRRVVERADALLASDAVWNRADNRRCPSTATAWSIYCAMERAEIDVTGGFHHRRPAMEVVRKLIEDRTAGRNYRHRLMGYNNDPRTRLSDVHEVFAEALARMPR
jgi:hypothetical protein